MKNKLFAILFLLTVLIGAGCSGKADEKRPGENTDNTSASKLNAEAAAAGEQLAYICPMECEGSASNEPGKCPVCAMDLVKNPRYKATAQDSAVHSTH